MLISNFVIKIVLFRIVIVQSKIDSNLPVPNRYFGVLENGSLKIRGIEARMHDTPHLFSKCQNEILEIIVNGNTISEVNALMPKVKDIFITMCIFSISVLLHSKESARERRIR